MPSALLARTAHPNPFLTLTTPSRIPKRKPSLSLHRGQALVLTSASVLPGYGIYGAHAPPYRLNTYDESEAGDNWDWHFIDSMYFTMATLTTVGYGDMPTLPQHMRLITIVFGLVGVLVIAGQIGVVVDYLAEGALVRVRVRVMVRVRGQG